MLQWIQDNTKNDLIREIVDVDSIVERPIKLGAF